jgi:hypothetical protein
VTGSASCTKLYEWTEMFGFHIDEDSVCGHLGCVAL